MFHFSQKIFKKQTRSLELRVWHFTAIINTNHQRKIFHSKMRNISIIETEHLINCYSRITKN